MEAPHPDDVDAAIVTSVYSARTLLSDAENQQITLPRTIYLCGQAARLLDAALVSLGRPNYGGRAVARVHVLRAVRAAEVAVATGKLARSYVFEPHESDVPPYGAMFHGNELDERTTKQVLTRLRKATAFAVAETHRALTQLAEDFPHAYAIVDSP
jgi:hypothetical protein